MISGVLNELDEVFAISIDGLESTASQCLKYFNKILKKCKFLTLNLKIKEVEFGNLQREK